MPTPYPSYEDTMRESREMADANRGLATFSEIGNSEEGRPLPLLTITDPSVPTNKKSVILITGGADGSEEVGRAINLAFARAMLRPERRLHLQRQVFLIAPNVNPDGSIRDKAANANGIQAPDVHDRDNAAPRTAEGRVMRALVDEWIPDAHVDFHGLAGGTMGDYSFLYPTVNKKWSLTTLMKIAAEVEEASLACGLPHQGVATVHWDWRGNLAGWLAKFNSTLCTVMETTENYYPIEDSVRSGLARLLKFIEIGEQVRFFIPYPQYACDVVSGNRMGALMPFGADYTIRRKCRRDMSRMIIEGVPSFGRMTCDHDWVARIHLPIQDSVKTFPEGMAIQATLDRRATVREVYWHDHKLEQGQWSIRPDVGGLVVRADIPEAPQRGDNTLSIKYEVPFKRHVEYPRSPGIAN